jgi:membrane associated rhomboid family serine protease
MPSSLSESLRKALDQCSLPGIIRYVILFNALVFVLHLLVPGFITVLELNPQLVLQGQIWRLITWIFIPETLSPFWIFFALLFLLYVGDGLEAVIGASRLTRFYLTGVALCTLVCFTFGLAGSGVTLSRANTFLNLSLLLAYATLFPGFQVLVLFIIPMRISWLAIISAVLMILSSLGQPLVVAATLGAAFLNYLLFFHKELRSNLASLHHGIANTSSSFPIRAHHPIPVESLHCCKTCGRTELSHPDLDFRVTADGSEYCREHLSKPQTLS